MIVPRIPNSLTPLAWMPQGMKSSRIYLLNGMVVFVFWLVGRLLWQLYVFHHLFRHRAELSLLTAAGQALVVGVPPALFSLNIWWFAKICRGVAKLLHGKQKVRHCTATTTGSCLMLELAHWSCRHACAGCQLIRQRALQVRPPSPAPKVHQQNGKTLNGKLHVNMADSRVRAKVT